MIACAATVPCMLLVSIGIHTVVSCINDLHLVTVACYNKFWESLSLHPWGSCALGDFAAAVVNVTVPYQMVTFWLDCCMHTQFMRSIDAGIKITPVLVTCSYWPGWSAWSVAALGPGYTPGICKSMCKHNNQSSSPGQMYHDTQTCGAWHQCKIEPLLGSNVAIADDLIFKFCHQNILGTLINEGIIDAQPCSMKVGGEGKLVHIDLSIGAPNYLHEIIIVLSCSNSWEYLDRRNSFLANKVRCIWNPSLFIGNSSIIPNLQRCNVAKFFRGKDFLVH